jgi:hypothetical protein
MLDSVVTHRAVDASIMKVRGQKEAGLYRSGKRTTEVVRYIGDGTNTPLYHSKNVS